MATFDLYGLSESDLNNAQALVASVIGIEMERRWSDFWGEYFGWQARFGEESIEIKPNFNLQENDWNEPEFREYPLLVYVDDSQRPEEIRSLLFSKVAGIALLRHEVL